MSDVTACNIPVFRYALERWKPDDTDVVIFHDGTLAPRQRDTIDRWQAQTIDGGGNGNVSVLPVDVTTDKRTELQQLWKNLSSTSQVEMPHVLIRTKVGKGRVINHWHGPIDEADEIGIFGSPIREELGQRLLAGHSVVWLVVGSSDQERTNAAKKMLEEHFGTLAQKIKMPEGIGLPGSELYASVPLVVRFSLLEIRPDDPEEKFLASLLTGIRRRAHEDGEPLLVPVFGRGRALEVIPAGDFSPRLMEDLTIFLSGACSCQVKEQNPGFDLLIGADWDRELFGDEENRPPDRSAEEGRNRDPVLLEIPSGRK